MRCINFTSNLQFSNLLLLFSAILEECKGGLQIRKHAEKLSKLRRVAPVICDSIVNLPARGIPNAIIDILDALREKICCLIEMEPHNLSSSIQDTVHKSNSMLPNWPQLNIGGIYKKEVVKRK